MSAEWRADQKRKRDTEHVGLGSRAGIGGEASQTPGNALVTMSSPERCFSSQCLTCQQHWALDSRFL